MKSRGQVISKQDVLSIALLGTMTLFLIFVVVNFLSISTDTHHLAVNIAIWEKSADEYALTLRQ